MYLSVAQECIKKMDRILLYKRLYMISEGLKSVNILVFPIRLNFVWYLCTAAIYFQFQCLGNDILP